MGKSLSVQCPHCSSVKVVRNGHPHNAQLEFFCKSCHKYFYENTIKGYPPTAIPYPVIAYLLYFHKRVPELSKMREFRKFASQWLNCLGIKKGEVSRQIIHHWIKKYEPGFEDIISFRESCNFSHRILSEKLKPIPKETLRAKTIPHTQVLCILEENLGHNFCVNLARSDRIFFNELCDLVSKYQLYQQQTVKDEHYGRPPWRPIFMRFLKCVND